LCGTILGDGYLWKYWGKACANLGVEGVSVYPGTKHSTATFLRKELGKEAAKEATGHTTDKAFLRYIGDDSDNLKALYSFARPDKGLTKDFCHKKDGNLLNFK